MVEPNISEGVEPLPLIAHQVLEDEIPKEPDPKNPLSIKMVLGEDRYASDQDTTDTSLEYNEFELSFVEYVQIFNELLKLKRAIHCFDVLLKIFNTSDIFKRR